MRPGSSETVSFMALIQVAIFGARDRIVAHTEHAVFRLQHDLDAKWHITRCQGGHADAEIDVVAIAKFLGSAPDDTDALVLIRHAGRTVRRSIRFS